MDPQRFDTLVRTLTTGRSRRRLLGLLAVLPGLGQALAAVADNAQAKGTHRDQGKGEGKGQGQGKAKRRNQRQRREQRHDRPRDQRGQQTKGAGHARAESCPLCRRPDRRGRCVADPAVNGKCCTAWGGRRGFCLAGACFAGQCTGPICNDQTCPDGCCDAQGQCHIDDQAACGTGGGTCDSCEVAGEVCQGGDCVCPSGKSCSGSGCCPNASDVCNASNQCCVKTTCAAQNAQCGTISDGCDGTLDCGGCPSGQTCGGGSPGTPNRCGGACPCIVNSAGTCFWLWCRSSGCCWHNFTDYDKDFCLSLDKCASGGACYKWDTTSC